MKRKALIVATCMLAIAIFAFLLLNTNWIAANSENRLPVDLQKFLNDAPQFEVLALNPIRASSNTNNATLLNYPILSRAKIEDKNVQKTIVEIFSRDVAGSHHPHSACILEPRHGIHCVEGTNIVDIAICYHCGDVLVEQNGNQRYFLIKTDTLFAPQSKKSFEKVLQKARINK